VKTRVERTAGASGRNARRVPSEAAGTAGWALAQRDTAAIRGTRRPPARDVPAAGEALDAPVRARMESAFGTDFSTVRVRRGEAAQCAMGQLGARAAAEGESIAFGGGEYAPGRPAGERLIAHELAHVLQARAAEGGGTPVGTAEAETQAERFAGVIAAGARVVDAASPAVGRHLAPVPTDNTDAEVLAILERPIGSNDVAGQRKRVEDLIALFRTKPFWVADALAVLFQTPAAGDAVAQAFQYRLSTETRQVLIGILRTRARSNAGLIDPNDPRKDANYVDEQFETVSCMLLWADRYRIQWPGGELTVFNDDIDWTKTTKALAHVTLSPDLAEARRKSTEWADVAKATGYDRVVAFYRGRGDVLLPNWFSPETTPKLFAAIMDVNRKIRENALGAEDAFRDLRNSLVIGLISAGVLRVFIRVMPGGGGLRGPRVGVDPDPVAPKPPAPKPPVDEPVSRATNELSSEAQRGIRSLEKRIAEHESKLADFKANPTVRPGMEAQPKALIEAAQQSRIKHLETEIQTFRKNIEKLKKGD
jgi:hypothetical protein